MMERIMDRYGALAGPVFVVLAVLGFVMEGSPPGVGDSSGEIADWYSSHEGRVKVAAALAVVAGVAFVAFGAHMAAAVRRRSSGGTLAAMALAGSAVLAAGIGVDSALRFALADTVGEIPAESTQTLFSLWDSFFFPMHVGAVLVALSVSASSFESKLLPTWLAGLGVVAAVLLVIPAEPVLIAGIIAFALWVLITSVVAFRQASAAPAQ